MQPDRFHPPNDFHVAVLSHRNFTASSSLSYTLANWLGSFVSQKAAMYFSLYRTGHQISKHWLQLSIGVTTIGAKQVLHIETSLRLKHLLPTGRGLTNKSSPRRPGSSEPGIYLSHAPVTAASISCCRHPGRTVVLVFALTVST